MKRLVAVAVLAAAVAAMLLFQHVGHLDHTRVHGLSYVRGFDRAHSSLDKTLGLGDGQAYAEIARDPTLARPGAFRLGHASAAYRFGRPLFGEVVWALSLGRPGAVTPVMAAVCIASVGAAAAAVASLIARRGGNPWLAVGTAFLPGAWSATTGLTSEGLALAFAAWAVVLWLREHRRVTPAVGVLFCLSVLTRETMILVPVALAAWSWRCTGTRFRRAVVTFVAAPAGVFAAWDTVVWIRTGAWPFAGGPTGSFDVPFAGILHSVSRWRGSPEDLLALVAGLALLTLTLRARRDDPLRAIVLAYALFAPFMGPAVWGRWQDFGRPLLPFYACALVVVATAPARTRAATVEPRETAGTEGQVMSSMR